MKKLFSALFIALLMVAISPKESFAQANPGGVLVLHSGGGFTCNGTFIHAFKTTTQIINGQIHVLHRLYDFNGTCFAHLIPVKGNNKVNVTTGSGLSGILIVTKNGIGKLTITNNPPITSTP